MVPGIPEIASVARRDPETGQALFIVIPRIRGDANRGKCQWNQEGGPTLRDKPVMVGRSRRDKPLSARLQRVLPKPARGPPLVRQGRWLVDAS